MHGDQRETDYYAILNLPAGSPEEVIHEQYRRMVKLLHPDRNGGDAWCQEQLKLVNAAYAVLSNIEAKNLYDQRRERRRTRLPSFAEELEQQISSDRSAEEERRSLDWSFDVSLHASARQPSGHQQIEFVTQHASLVCDDAQTTIDDAARGCFASAEPSGTLSAGLQPAPSRLRALLIVCAALLAVFGSVYIASPKARSIVRPLLRHELTSANVAQRRVTPAAAPQ